MAIGFDNEQYMRRQSEQILERIRQSQGKLYLEFGGKLFDDYHAARVLPGFDVNGKVKLLHRLREKAEILLCISAHDIEQNKIRADLGITYDTDVLRLMDNLREMDLLINSVIITQYDGQPGADIFRKQLEFRGVKTYIHRPTKGYPTDVAVIVSEEGYGANPYIPTTRPLVVVTAPGPSSGKMATCLGQLYHEHRRGNKAGYAKFETFPVWNLPLKHPVNMAYEAATADLSDVNMIDPFHLEAYGETTVNYNRDIAVFPVVSTILSKTSDMGMEYRSPTDMGVNMVGLCITDEDAVQEAANQEIIRRHFRLQTDYKLGRVEKAAVKKVEMIMSQLGITVDDRRVVGAALAKMQEKNAHATAIELPGGRIITGRETGLMNAPASALINAIKEMAGVADDLYLISPVVLEPVIKLKKDNLGAHSLTLNLEEVLICLSICAATNPTAELAVEQLSRLRGCEIHSSYILPESDGNVLRRLGLNSTCEPEFPGKQLYYE